MVKVLVLETRTGSITVRPPLQICYSTTCGHRFSEIIRPYQWTNYTVQYSDIDTTRQSPDEHEDFVYAANPSSGTMRYNIWWGSPNDGIFFDMGGNSLTFYGNVVYHSGGAVITFKTGLLKWRGDHV